TPRILTGRWENPLLEATLREDLSLTTKQSEKLACQCDQFSEGNGFWPRARLSSAAWALGNAPLPINLAGRSALFSRQLLRIALACRICGGRRRSPLRSVFWR